MSQLYKHWRVPLGALFFLFFISCSGKTSAPHWKHSSTRSLSPRYTTMCATYTTANVCRNLQLEVRRSRSEKCRVTLNIFALPFTEATDFPGMTHVTIEAGSNTQKLLAHRLAGGQQLLFDDITAAWICSTLDTGQAMTITAGHYTGTITTTGWRKRY